MLPNEEQGVIDHINRENECMDKGVSIIQRILNYLSLFGKLLCCRQVNSIGITIDFPSVVDMMRYKYGRTEEIINNEVSDLIMESSRCIGHTIKQANYLLKRITVLDETHTRVLILQVI